MIRAKSLFAKALALPLAASMVLGSVPVYANAASGTATDGGLDTSYIFTNLGAENMGGVLCPLTVPIME